METDAKTETEAEKVDTAVESATIKREPPDEISDYAENTMNELLGLYGYGKVDRSDSNQIQHGGQSEDELENEVLDEKCLVRRSPDDKGVLGETDGEAGLVQNEEAKPTECNWCHKTTEKYYSLKTPTGTRSFCSDLCFQQCRRASFKKNKICDWCKHTRHTVNYVDFQDGDHQVQFCSDKCLNQYKMNIFCRETQEHLKTIKNDQSEDESRSRHSSAEILITPDLWMKPEMPSSLSPEVKRERGRSTTPDERASIVDWEMKMRQRSLRKAANPKQLAHSPMSSGSHLESPGRSSGTPESDMGRMRRLEAEKRLPIGAEHANSQMLPHLSMPPMPYPHYSLPLLPPPPPFIPPGMPMMPPQSGLLPFPVFVPVPFPLPIPVPILPKGVTAEDVKEFVRIMKKDKAVVKEEVKPKVQLQSQNGHHHQNHVTVKPRDPERPRDHHDRKCPKRGSDCINCASCQVASRRQERIAPRRPREVAKYHLATTINHINNNNNDHHKTLNIVNDYNEAIDLSKSKKPRVESSIMRDTSSAPLPKINIVPSRPPLSLPPLSATPAPPIDAANNPHSSRRALLLDSPNAPIGKKRSPSPETQRTRSLIDYKKRCLRARIKSK